MVMEMFVVAVLWCPGDFNCTQTERAYGPPTAYSRQQGGMWGGTMMPPMPAPNDVDRHPGEGPLSANPNDPESVYNPLGLYRQAVPAWGRRPQAPPSHIPEQVPVWRW